jgi:hypothetical protein
VAEFAVSLNSAGLFIEDGWLVSIVSGVQALTSVSLDSALTDLSGSNFSISDVTWNSTAIAVNFANVTFSQQTQIFLDVTGTPSIPEPSTWVLMALGLAGIGFAGSRNASIFQVRNRSPDPSPPSRHSAPDQGRRGH